MDNVYTIPLKPMKAMTPLAIHVSEMAPISSRITIAIVTSPTPSAIAFSKLFHGVL